MTFHDAKSMHMHGIEWGSLGTPGRAGRAHEHARPPAQRRWNEGTLCILIALAAWGGLGPLDLQAWMMATARQPMQHAV